MTRAAGTRFAAPSSALSYSGPTGTPLRLAASTTASICATASGE